MKYHHKEIHFYLSQSYWDVKLKIQMPRLSFLRRKKYNYPVQWLEILEEIYTYVGLKIDDEFLRELYTPEYLNILIKDSTISVLFLGPLTIIGTILFLMYYPWGSIFGFVLIYFMLFPCLQNLFKWTKKRRELYPDR
jgi:hypothetical protein